MVLNFEAVASLFKSWSQCAASLQWPTHAAQVHRQGGPAKGFSTVLADFEGTIDVERASDAGLGRASKLAVAARGLVDNWVALCATFIIIQFIRKHDQSTINFPKNNI